ncbi:hypothetical protein cypCar_00040669 [Cyprinus carpio]|nr:hypothetical protein cypCar_00040669 [Cyprinus carpio]
MILRNIIVLAAVRTTRLQPLCNGVRETTKLLRQAAIGEQRAVSGRSPQGRWVLEARWCLPQGDGEGLLENEGRCCSYFSSSVPMRSYSWRHHNHPFSLSFLEEVLRWIGMNEVHKAITLFLDTVGKQPGTPRIQRSLYREMLFLTLAAMGKDHVADKIRHQEDYREMVLDC